MLEDKIRRLAEYLLCGCDEKKEVFRVEVTISVRFIARALDKCESAADLTKRLIELTEDHDPFVKYLTDNSVKKIAQHVNAFVYITQQVQK